MRRAMLAVVLVLTAITAGCGSGGSSAQTPAPETTAAPPAKGPATLTGAPLDGPACQAKLGRLIAALDDINGRLDVGLAPGDYSTRVGTAQVAYEALDLGPKDTDCGAAVGVFAEQALQHYLKANTRWQACVTTYGCSADAILPGLRADWLRSQLLLKRVHKTLKAATPSLENLK